jgi:hypothetical protein
VKTKQYDPLLPYLYEDISELKTYEDGTPIHVEVARALAGSNWLAQEIKVGAGRKGDCKRRDTHHSTRMKSTDTDTGDRDTGQWLVSVHKQVTLLGKRSTEWVQHSISRAGN